MQPKPLTCERYLNCLTIDPAFICAAICLCLARIVVVYGENPSRVRPRTCTILFVSCNFLSLMLQAVGGAITATADDDEPDKRQNGINIIITGLSTQVAYLAIFSVLCTEYAWRVLKRPLKVNDTFLDLCSTFMWKAFLGGLATATLTVLVRSVFRVAELSGGFTSKLANDEITSTTLEGAMMIIACTSLTIFHPGLCFGGKWNLTNWSLREPKNGWEINHDKCEA